MHLESWAAFGLTTTVWSDEVITGFVPYLLGYQPTETVVAIGFKNGQPSLTATWPMERLVDHAAYAEPAKDWAPLCDRLYLLVYTENDEQRFDAAEALWYEERPEFNHIDHYETVAVSSRGQFELNHFNRYDDDFEEVWAPVRWPHPVLARMFALSWNGCLDPAQRPRAGDLEPTILEGRYEGALTVKDPDPHLHAYYPRANYGAALMDRAFLIAQAFDAIWVGDDPGKLSLGYWRTAGRDQVTGTAQALAAAITAFAIWRWGQSGAERAAADAVAADPECTIALAVARLVGTGFEAEELRRAPYRTANSGDFQGPAVPVLDKALHDAIRQIVTATLEQAPDPEGDRFAHSTRYGALCGASDGLRFHDLHPSRSDSYGLEELIDQANAATSGIGLDHFHGVAALRTRGGGYRTADVVLLDGSGQRYFRGDSGEQPSWTAWSTFEPDLGRSEYDQLHRLAQALRKAGNR